MWGNDRKIWSKLIIRRFEINIRGNIMEVRYTDHKNMPWAKKKYVSKIRFTDYNEPDSDKAKGIIDKTVSLLQNLQKDHPFLSDFTSVLLKISAIIVGLKGVLVGLGSVTQYHVVTSISKNVTNHVKQIASSDQIKEAEKLLNELKKEMKTLDKSMSSLKLSLKFNPRLVLLKGLLRATWLILVAYVANATAKILSAKKQFEYEYRDSLY